MSKQSLRNVLRYGGLAVAIIGFILSRTAQTAGRYHAARILVWVGFGMIVAGIVVRMFIREQ